MKASSLTPFLPFPPLPPQKRNKAPLRKKGCCKSVCNNLLFLYTQKSELTCKFFDKREGFGYFGYVLAATHCGVGASAAFSTGYCAYLS